MQKAGRRRRFRHPASHLLQALGRRLRAASCRLHHSRQQGIGFRPGGLGLGRPGLAKATLQGPEQRRADTLLIWRKGAGSPKIAALVEIIERRRVGAQADAA